MKNLILSLIFMFFASTYVFGQLTNKSLGTTASANGYIEYLPPAYRTNPDQRLPIILFFHGSGENGNGTTDLYKIYNTGLPKIIKNNSWTYKNQFVVLMPQHTSNNQYDLCPSATEIKNFINFARKEYNVDTLQLFITGLSCGGNGVWRYLGAYPSNEKVAAAIPISANGTAASNGAGCNIMIPIWAFHGNLDTTSPWKNDVTANDFFKACPPPHAEAKLTLYPGVGHDAWSQTYDLSAGHDIYAWLLQQKSPSQIPNNITMAKDNDKMYYSNQTLFYNNCLNATIELLDIMGKSLFKQHLKEISTNIHLSQYKQGVYIAKLSNNDYKQTLKIIL